MAQAPTPAPAPRVKTADRRLKAATLVATRAPLTGAPLTGKRAALVKRLKAKADAADRGEMVSLAGLNDDELIAALTCR